MRMAAPPVISVVTVCFNAAATIERTLQSLKMQTYPLVESIIIDGLSTDDTLSIVAQFSGPMTKIVSEKDAGIYDAMNKGIALSTGDVLYFLNADDSFVDQYVLEDVARAFVEDEQRLFIYGNVIYERAPPGINYGPASPFKTFSVHELLRTPFCHQAVFARRSLFTTCGTFDTRYRYVADYDWYIKVFKRHPQGFHLIERNIAHYFYQGRSTTDGKNTKREKRAVWYRHLKSPALFWYDFRYTFLRGLKKRLLREQ